MTHFRTAVVAKSYEDAVDKLAPYSEYLAVEPYVSHENVKAAFEDSDYDDFKEFLSYEYGVERSTLWVGEPSTIYDAENDTIVSTVNRDSHYDYYSRTSGADFLNLVDGLDVTEQVAPRPFNVKYVTDFEEVLYRISVWNYFYNDDTLPYGWDDEYPNQKYRDFLRDTLKDNYANAADYARDYSEGIGTIAAIVNDDGEWLAPEEVGWFGCTYGRTKSRSDEFFDYCKKIAGNADYDDFRIYVFDCHI